MHSAGTVPGEDDLAVILWDEASIQGRPDGRGGSVEHASWWRGVLGELRLTTLVGEAGTEAGLPSTQQPYTLFGPAASPGFSAGWSLGRAADSTRLFTRFGYLSSQTLTEDAGPAAWETGEWVGEALAYEVGMATGLGERMNLSLSYSANRWRGERFQPLAEGYGEARSGDAALLHLGLNYGNRGGLWLSTPLRAERPDETPDVLLSLRFACCF